MSGPPYARLASKMLGELDSPLPPPAPVPSDRARAIAILARTLADRGRRRRQIRWGSVAVVAAAAMLVIFARHARLSVRSVSAVPTASMVHAVSHPNGSEPKVVVLSAPANLARLDDGSSVPAGSRVVTPGDGRATLSFASGTSAFLREGTDMTVESEGTAQIMRVEAGSVEFHVAKLGPAERFLVDTPDSEVEVRGTRFRVSVVAPERGCDVWTKTRVVVTEGVVVVRHRGIEVHLGVGEQWPVCGREMGVAAMPSALKHTLALAPAAAAPSPTSTLADQNDLFAAGVAAKLRGDSRGALLAFEQFLAWYPKSPLIESAAVERMRLMHDVAPERSVAVANDYLARYPNGFAHSEAEAILAGPP